jgi:DNA-directed RNA polymerase subunit RPC12/RpoP
MSDIKFNCPQCGQHLAVDAMGAGMTVACPKCGQAIRVPQLAHLVGQVLPERTKRWWWLSAGIAAALMLIAGLLVCQTRRQQTTAAGSASAPLAEHFAFHKPAGNPQAAKDSNLPAVQAAPAKDAIIDSSTGPEKNTQLDSSLKEGTIAPKVISSEIPIYSKSLPWPLKQPGDEVMLPTVAGFAWNLDRDNRRIDQAHSLGAKFITEISLWNHDLWRKATDLPPELKDAYVRDFNGNLVYNQDMVFMNLRHPAWQKWQFDHVQNQIDAGADGMVVDETEGNAAAVEMGVGMDDWSLSGFGFYLESKYSSAELAKQGITDIAHFNYRSFLLSHNLDAKYKSAYASVQFGCDYYNFQLSEASKFIKSLISFARDYSRKKGKEFLITANVDPFFRSDECDYYDSLDYYTFEHPYIWAPYRGHGTYPTLSPSYSVAPKAKYAIAKGKFAVPLMIIFDYGELAKKPSIEANQLVQLFFSESYAHRAFLAYFDLDQEFVGNKFSADHAQLQPYYSFVRANPRLFKDLKTYSDVAIVHCPKFTRDDYGPVDATSGAAMAFASSNIPYDVIPIDSLLTSSPYKTVVANGYYWSDWQLAKLLSFARNGGTVITFDSRFAQFDENGMTKSRPSLDVLKIQGVHTIGVGKFIFFNNNLAWRYWAYQKSSDEEVMIKAADVPFNFAPSKVELVPYVRDDGALVIHMLNYAITANGAFDREHFGVKVKLPSGFSTAGKTLAIYLPEKNESAQPDFKEENGYLSFSVPRLHIYAVAELKVRVALDTGR